MYKMWNQYRLPGTIIPLSYEIYLNPIAEKSLILGRINIKVSLKEPSKYIVLHGRDIIVNMAIINEESKSIEISQVIYDSKLEYIHLMTENELHPGEIMINLEFQSHIRDDMFGCYKSYYLDGHDNKHLVLATQFEAIHARSVFPCFDEPQLKATFSLILDINKNYMAFSNMPQYKRINLDLNIDRIFFKTSPKMSTYTLAFVIGEYALSLAKNRVLSVIAPPNNSNLTELALHVAVHSMDIYEKVLNMKYTLPKLDLIAIPDSAAGAMENWGLVTFRPSALLIYDKYSSELDKDYVADTVAHELAHQFFGNLCTTKWWSTIWLNEGIATYFEYLGFDNSFPKWKIWDTFVFKTQQEAMNKDKFISSHPLNNQLFNNDEIEEMFDAITYEKGGSILYMVADMIGVSILYEGLHNYLTQCSYGNGTPELLWNNIEETTKKHGNYQPINEMMKSWTYQAGFPLIIVEEYPDGIILRQERYQPYKKEKSNELWWISLKIGYSNGNQIIVQFDSEQSKFIPLDTTWYKVNYNHHGFVRVNYPIKTWDKIITNGILNIRDRAGLLNDVLTLSLDGKLPIETALSVVYKILSKEKEYSVWMSAINFLYKLGNLFINHDCWEYYRIYVISLLNSMNEWIWNPIDDHSQILLRSELLSMAIFFEESNIAQICDEIFFNWIYNKSSSSLESSHIPLDLQTPIFRNVIRTMGDFAFKILYELYIMEKNPVQRKRYLFALTASKSTKLLQNLLDISLDSTMIDPQNRINLIILIGTNPFGREITWKFIKKNWNLLDIRGQSIINLLEVVVGSFYTQELYNDAESFLTSHPNVAKSATNMALETIKYNMEWKLLYIDNACEWLKTFVSMQLHHS